ncbi:hypothetical protein SI65_02385 [Aspergillus cristatus]|uniref:Acyl-CoA dehydrogenase/oxidase C-terminal domain-containing protein n=1 Tax=Aspergillus cristatus TaxID=573508 RepID=A0A1E3BL66_ASPCR|nr:hypothetical protein SI65_02385 [Aspergillus cristatus]
MEVLGLCVALRPSFLQIFQDIKIATADSGYFLTSPPLSNPLSSDPVYQRILSAYLPPDILSQIQPNLNRFAAEAISESVHDLVRNAESQPPFVKTRNVWGSRPERYRLVTSDGWKQFGKWGLSNGLLAMDMRTSLVRIGGFNYIYSASSAAYSCPVSMTSGACHLVRFHLDSVPTDHPFHELYAKLTARENSWVSAQWMTERAGGSDVRNSETVAVYSPLPPKLANLRNVAFILAKTESGQLSLFVAPTVKTVRGEDGRDKEVTNGIRIHRLKQKFGTKELPTAELELKGVRAHMVGPKDRGIATIAMLLNVTRTHNFITALSCLRRAIEISKCFARSRKTLDQPLWTFPMHLHTLAQLEVKHRGWMHLAFFTTSLLSYDEPEEPEYNVSRLWRDTASNSVWEGTTNVLASETVRHLTRGENPKAFGTWIRDATGNLHDPYKRTLLSACEALYAKLDVAMILGGLATAYNRQTFLPPKATLMSLLREPR